MADDKLQFSFELVDNVSDNAKSISDTVESADSSVNKYDADALKANQDTKMLQTSVQATQLNLLTQMAVLGSLDGAVKGITGGLQTLGLVSDETSERLNKISAAFGIIKGTAQGLTAVKALMATLNAQTAINASLSSYLAVLKNPAMMAGVAVAGGAAVGVAGAYLMTNHNSSTTNNSTTINVEDTTPTQATSNFIRVVEGGAL